MHFNLYGIQSLTRKAKNSKKREEGINKLSNPYIEDPYFPIMEILSYEVFSKPFCDIHLILIN